MRAPPQTAALLGGQDPGARRTHRHLLPSLAVAGPASSSCCSTRGSSGAVARLSPHPPHREGCRGGRGASPPLRRTRKSGSIRRRPSAHPVLAFGDARPESRRGATAGSGGRSRPAAGGLAAPPLATRPRQPPSSPNGSTGPASDCTGSSQRGLPCPHSFSLCSKESCYSQKDSISVQQRAKAACKPGVDYVYKTRVIETEEVNSYSYYIMEVLEFFKTGDDINPQNNRIHKFISPVKCKESLHLEENKDYLIWGLSSDMWLSKSELNYRITRDTWIEKWPNKEECQEEEYQALCNDLVEFSNTMTFDGCQT